MTFNNPFPFSDDNKRYHTWNYYLKHRFHNKVFKVALNANFSCPNRDGTCGSGGCTFCSSMGSGDYAGDIHDSLQTQYIEGTERMRKKWPAGIPMPYFQAFSNTYASLSKLKETFEPFLQNDDIQAISIATRADCLDQEKINYFNSYAKKKEVWMELGLQSIHDSTALQINRGHTYQDFLDCIHMLEKSDIKICVHIINSLPNESADMMVESVKAISTLPIHAVKIHMLHIMEHTKMAQEYREEPFHVLTKEEYIDIVIRQLEVLPPEIIIQRLTGDGVKEQLITPSWTLKKVVVLNDIDKEMKRRDTWQGKRFP
ncbi:MAG: TIGR01212 family radical SAM protein [Longicatena sp.]